MRRVFGTVHWCRCKSALLILVGALAVFLTTTPARGTRVGVAVLGGGGIFVPIEDRAYQDNTPIFYPEVGLQIDISAVRLGLRAGWIYKTITHTWYMYDGYYGYQEYTRSYIPLQAELLIAPLDLFMKEPMLSPYAGVMAGTFLAVGGDNDDTELAISGKLGSEIRLDPIVLYGDLRYTWVRESEDYWAGDYNVGGFMVVAGLGLRLGL